MRAIVCGGRRFADEDLVSDALARLGVSFVIEGGASGADELARRWAARNLGPGCWRQFKANWKENGHAAGPMRNQAMIDQGKPEAVIAFPGGRGTSDMLRRAKKSGLKIYEIHPHT